MSVWFVPTHKFNSCTLHFRVR